MSVNDCLKNYVDMIGIKQSYLSEKTKIPADTISRILNVFILCTVHTQVEFMGRL